MKLSFGTNDSLTMVMAGAAATTNPTYHVTHVGEPGSIPVCTSSSLNGTTAVSAITGTGVPRTFESLEVCNVDTAAVTITIARVVYGTSYTVKKVTLQVSDTFVMDAAGIRVTDTSGSVKQSGSTTATQVVALTPFAWRVHDAVATNLPATAAADDLAVINGTDGTAFPSIRTLDFKATTTTAYARTYAALPPNYVAGGAITLRAVAGMLTTISDATCTVDFEVFSNDGDATGSADLCATAATSINSLTFGNKDFTITPTGLVAGQLLNIRMVIAGADTATATAVLGTIAAVELRCVASQ